MSVGRLAATIVHIHTYTFVHTNIYTLVHTDVFVNTKKQNTTRCMAMPSLMTGRLVGQNAGPIFRGL